MNAEQKFYLSITSLCLLAILYLSMLISLSTYDTNKFITESKDPIATACAIKSIK